MPQRQEAQKAGLKTYFTGKPCKYGHTSLRRVNGGCIECIPRIQKEKYLRCRNDPLAKEKRSAQARRAYLKRGGHIKEKVKQYALKNKVKILAKKAEYRAKNREYLRVKARERYYKLMATKPKEFWESVRNATRRYRAKKVNAEGRHGIRDIRKLMEIQQGKCNVCSDFINTGKSHAFHVDHIYPLSRGGKNSPDNLQLLCRSCNCGKRDKLPNEWEKFITENKPVSKR